MCIRDRNNSWNCIVNRWQIENGFKVQKVYPNISGPKSSSPKAAHRYITKMINLAGHYLTKDQDSIQEIEGNIWSCSKHSRKFLETETIEKCRGTVNDIHQIFDSIQEQIFFENNGSKFFTIEGTGQPCIYIPAPERPPPKPPPKKT